MKMIFFTFLFLLAVSSCDKPKADETPVNPNDLVIHTIDEFNNDSEPDLHAGEETHSCLEAMYPYMQIIGKDVLGTEKPVYSRIKQCKDGSYILFFQANQVASTIYYSKSDDLLTWSDAEIIFRPYSIDTPEGKDERRYSSADGIVLSNGDILIGAAFRANSKYRKYPELNGVAIKRSTDNGATWSDEQVIYQGTNWEPYFLELPSGKIQCYFTDTEPNVRNSGTSIVESSDMGYTWTPTGVSNCYKVIRQYKYMTSGQRIYTDQMASVRMLSDGHTLIGFMEARLEEPTPSSASVYKMSLVYAEDEFPHLEGDAVGPEDRQDNLFAGAGGYVSVFPSGEPLISCNISNVFSMKLGTLDGKKFNGSSWTSDWYQPFAGKGFWGATEVISSHKVIGTMHSGETIQYGVFYLNHRINAPEADIKVDGSNAEWKADQALFIGSAAENVGTVIRASHDDKNIYVLVERTDKYLNTGDDLNIYLTGADEADVNKAVRINWSESDGFRYTSYGTDKTWTAESPVKCEAAIAVKGKFTDGRSDSGYIVEIAVPLDAIGGTSKGVLLDAEVKDGVTTDSFSGVNTHSPQKWMLIKLN